MEKAKNIFVRSGKPKTGNSNTAARAGSSIVSTTNSKKPGGNPEAAPLKLRVPDFFNDGDPVLFMSASHRGDMYHFRAALQVENFSLVLYDSTEKTEDLEAYLAKSVLMRGKHVFIVSWTYAQLHGDKTPPHPTRCYVDGQKYDKQAHKLTRRELNTYSEKAATRIIANAPNRLQDVINGMAILDIPMHEDKFLNFKELSDKFSAKHPEVSTGFEKQWEAWTKEGVKPGENAILLMYRGSGTEELGVYPELDNGGATEQIGKIVDEISPLNVFTCGLDISATRSLPAGELPGIGKFWGAIDKLNPNKAEISKRDFQAYFMKWSYERDYFKMATGFRSGALDLFTFMGIPTVSIGLRNLMGENRHQLLARQVFKRVNIQYDQPRHKVTAAVVTKRKSWETTPKPDQTTFGSPFWDPDFLLPDNAKKRAKPADTEVEQKQKARSFSPLFDKTVVEIGYRFAFEKHMNSGQTIRTLRVNPKTNTKELPRTITTSEARFCYPYELSNEKTIKKAALEQYFDAKAEGDYKAVEAMRKRSEELQLSETMIKKYEKDYDDNWIEVAKLVSPIIGKQKQPKFRFNKK